jgi:hypothetical protein
MPVQHELQALVQGLLSRQASQHLDNCTAATWRATYALPSRWCAVPNALFMVICQMQHTVQLHTCITSMLPQRDLEPALTCHLADNLRLAAGPTNFEPGQRVVLSESEILLNGVVRGANGRNNVRLRLIW